MISVFGAVQAQEPDPWVTFTGTAGPGLGKHLVLISGDEEYRSEEALPMLARILAVHHGFKCTVLFSINPEDGTIDPTNQTNIPGMQHLDGADMMVLFTRFRELPDESMKHFVSFFESGKPILGIRTATHAFHYRRNPKSPYAHHDWRSQSWKGGFGRQVLGETWVNHHGAHGRQSTRGVINSEHRAHPILRGVRDIWGPTDVYGITKLAIKADVLVRGQVLQGMKPGAAPLAGPKNDPMMPLIWAGSYVGEQGRKSRIICSTIGASVDCQSEDLRRVFINSCYWGLGLERKISEKSRVDIVGSYEPSFFGFGKYKRGVRPSDHALPKRPPPEAEKPTIEKGDRICLIGNALAERMQHHGWLETLLQSRLPGHRISLRNLGFSADELSVRQRTAGFGSWDDYLGRCKASVVWAFFGYNESFGGRAASGKFQKDLERFIDHTLGQIYDGRTQPRLVLFSSIPQENLHDRSLPDGKAHNERIQLYNRIMSEVARSRGIPCMDLYSPMLARYASATSPLTLNGIHLTSAGNRALAEIIASNLGVDSKLPTLKSTGLSVLQQAVLAKNLIWFNRYRATDGYNVYGGRSSLKYTDDVSNRTVLQREMQILDALAEEHTRSIWALAAGSDREIDHSALPKSLRVVTNKPGPGSSGEHAFADGKDAIRAMTPAPGMEINLFADEKKFPELANPVQMAWDTRGRLWVAVWPTYPHWEPGTPMNDKLLILEDEDGDGTADRCKVFAGDLHNPTGFAFWGGGVLVANAPDLLFLQDTDGDDIPDVRRRILHGLSSADTHHSANSFEIGPDGALYFQEGTFHRSQIETIHGPVRNRNGCVWRFEPRTWRVERHVAYNFANPHGHVFDRWGQDFVTDGTGNLNFFALPFSGRVVHPDKHRPYFTFFKQRSRPCGGTEILSSRHFPEANQGNYLIANVIGFQGIFQYAVEARGSGFAATEVAPIVHSSDIQFRPVDIRMGPDGAIYFLDWYNPLIGHMQHHLRDPSRDKSHGRIYRVTSRGRPLLTPQKIAGRPIPELLTLLESPEDRVRTRVRTELSSRDTKAVISAAKTWLGALDSSAPDFSHHLLEALWLHQQNNVLDQVLLERALQSPDPRARAAATRVLRGLRHLVPEPFALLRTQARDPHAQVRLEAVVAASFFDSLEAAEVALEVLRHPMDRFMEYAIAETMRTLKPHWRAAIARGELVGADNPSAVQYLLGRVSTDELLKLPQIPAVLEAILTRHDATESALKDAMTALASAHHKNPGAVLLDAIQRTDRSEAAHGRHVLMKLGHLLQTVARELPGDARSTLSRLATKGRMAETRHVAVAAMIVAEGSAANAWRAARASRSALEAFLGAVPLLTDPALRAEVHANVRPLMFQIPKELGEHSQGSKGTEPTPGVRVAFFGEAPRDASLRSMGRLTPEGTTRTANFSIEVKQVRSRKAFALHFTGTLRVPTDGSYTFYSRSDDGSRIYIDGRCVVNNDGDHGMREASGQITLGTGPHSIAITYYDRGGDDGLEISWQGPGFARQPIPDASLSSAMTDILRAAAVRAIGHVPGHTDTKLRDAAQLVGEGTLLDSAVYLVERIPKEAWQPNLVMPLIQNIAAHVASLPHEMHTAPHVIAALELGKKLTSALPDQEAREARKVLADLSGSVILIRTVPHQMRYDRREFSVQKGKAVAIVFQNNDLMPHNLVITRPGALQAVGTAAEAIIAGADPTKTSYVPDSDDVLWDLRLLLPGETLRLNFVAPDELGDYPYVCTFPGHWRVMNGIMHVVEEVDPDANIAPRPEPGETIPGRSFVRMWTVADLAPDLQGGWMQGRSITRGRQVMATAGCLKCHVFQGEGTGSSVDFKTIGEKYRGADLLRQIIEPSANILEGYESWYIIRDEGDHVVGRIVKEDEMTLHICPNLQNPEEIVIVPKSDIEERVKLDSSAMPTGLLVTFTREEILALLALLQTDGK